MLQGTRLLSNCIITLAFPLPLPLAAATHLAVVLLTRNNAQYCQTEVGGVWVALAWWVMHARLQWNLMVSAEGV